MNMTELKEKIFRDTERIKVLDVEILSEKILYKEAFQYVKLSYCGFLISFFALIIPALLIHGQIFHLFTFTTMFMGFAFFMFCLHAICFSKITQYVALKRTVFPKLETGEFLNQKILSLRNIIVTFMVGLLGIYSLIACFFGFDLSSDPSDFISGFGAYVLWIFVPTLFFAKIIISNEFNRLGISTFFSLIRSTINKSAGNSGEKVFSQSSEDTFKAVKAINNPSNPFPNDPYFPY